MTNLVPGMEAAPSPIVEGTQPQRLERVEINPDPNLGNGANVGRLLRAGSGFRILSGIRGSDIILAYAEGDQPGKRVADNPRALTNLATGQLYPVSFDQLDVIWEYDQAGAQTAAKRPVVLEVVLGHDSRVLGVAGPPTPFIEEHLTRGDAVQITNSVGGKVIWTDHWANESDLLVLDQDELGRAYWDKSPHPSHFGTIDCAFNAAAEFEVGFFFWSGVAMYLFRTLTSASQTFAGGAGHVLMGISPAPPGGFEIRVAKTSAGTTDLSYSGCVRGGMRL